MRRLHGPIMTTLLLTLSLFCAEVQAEKIEGIIFFSENSKIQIQLTGETESYHLLFSTVTIGEYLLQLQPRDFLSAKGKISRRRKTVKVEEIFFVGLHRLLGLWQASNQHIYEFKDYQTLLLHSSNSAFQKSLFDEPERIEYSLLPQKDDKWTLFLNDGQEVSMGDLVFYKDSVLPDTVRLDIYDPITGKLQFREYLSPIATDDDDHKKTDPKSIQLPNSPL
jgi:hypothetical protein